MGEKYITDFEGIVTLCGINSNVFEVVRFLDTCRQYNKPPHSIKGRKRCKINTN
jgi:hypothetical protein